MQTLPLRDYLTPAYPNRSLLNEDVLSEPKGTGTMLPPPSIDEVSIATIRTLSMDAVQKAGSGHPGTPMAMAPVALLPLAALPQFRPDDPIWPNRDRFVLSIDHASMLLYSLLHLAGVRAAHHSTTHASVPSGAWIGLSSRLGQPKPAHRGCFDPAPAARERSTSGPL